MGQLTYLLDEICAGVEIYYTGRTGGQYLKTAFILCDDYTELTSKLFLLTDDTAWSDTKSNSRFKNFHDIQKDVQKVFKLKKLSAFEQIEKLHAEMAKRRVRRNDFFHSTHLLDLSVTQRICVEAFCDLLEYGKLLFGEIWTTELCSARNMETMGILLLLERKSFSDPSVTPKVNDILAKWPRNIVATPSKKGVHITSHPEDLHLRLCVVSGGQDLKEKLKTLL